MKINNINRLLGVLHPNLKDVERCHSAIEQLNVSLEDLETYMFWNDTKYTRNLISKTEAFELFLCCWEPGQASNLHDLNGQNGWVKVLSGSFELNVHSKNGSNSFQNELKHKYTKELKPKDVHTHVPNAEMYSLRNIGKERAVSLHLYSLPISHYHINKGLATDVDYINVAYDSISGMKIKN